MNPTKFYPSVPDMSGSMVRLRGNNDKSNQPLLNPSGAWGSACSLIPFVPRVPLVPEQVKPISYRKPNAEIHEQVISISYRKTKAMMHGPQKLTPRHQPGYKSHVPAMTELFPSKPMYDAQLYRVSIYLGYQA